MLSIIPPRHCFLLMPTNKSSKSNSVTAFIVPAASDLQRAKYLGMDSALELIRGAQAAGFLARQGIKSFAFEASSPDQIAHKAQESPIKLAVLLPTYATLDAAFDTAKSLKALKDSPHVAFAGELATFAARDLMEGSACLDSVIVGEVEAAAIQLFSAIDNGNGSGPDIQGLAWRDNAQEAIRINSTAPAIDLDELAGIRLDALNAPVALTSRGCPGSCSFCSENRFYGVNNPDSWRAMSAENAALEVIEVARVFKDTPGKGIVHVVDANFIGPPESGKERAKEFAQILITKKANVYFELRMRADSLNENDTDLIELLRRAGLVSVFLGLEAFSRPSLGLYEKGITWGENLAAIDLFEKHDITTASSSFILFHPWITFGELRREAGIMLRAGKSALWNLTRRLALLPGAPIARKVGEDGLLTGEKLYTNPFAYRFVRPEVEILLKFMDRLEQVILEEDALVRGIRMLKAKTDRSLWIAGISKPGCEEMSLKKAEWSVLSANHDMFVKAIEAIKDNRNDELESIRKRFLESQRECLAQLKSAFKNYLAAMEHG